MAIRLPSCRSLWACPSVCPRLLAVLCLRLVWAVPNGMSLSCPQTSTLVPSLRRKSCIPATALGPRCSLLPSLSALAPSSCRATMLFLQVNQADPCTCSARGGSHTSSRFPPQGTSLGLPWLLYSHSLSPTVLFSLVTLITTWPIKCLLHADSQLEWAPCRMGLWPVTGSPESKIKPGT